MTGKVWFITGTSRGFGREWATAALERGDGWRRPPAISAVSTTSSSGSVSRSCRSSRVTDRDADFAAAAAAHERFGRLDVVVNNAGYGHFGFVEEVTEREARAQIETNLFGALWITQAALPFLRAQGSGHIIQVSSIGGISAFPIVGLYHASKWALEGFSQALSQEVSRFGIHVTLIEPGGFSTDWAGSSAVRSAPHPDYAELHDVVAKERKTRWRRPATRRPVPARYCGSSMPTSHRCGSSSARRRWASPWPTMPAGSDLGEVERRLDRGAGVRKPADRRPSPPALVRSCQIWRCVWDCMLWGLAPVPSAP